MSSRIGWRRILRRHATIAVVALLVASCGGSGTAPKSSTAPVTNRAATDFAISADRALDGTRFEALAAADLARALVSICAANTPLSTAISNEIAAFDAPVSPVGDGTMAEVLIAGVAEVCPDRAAADLTAAYLATVAQAVSQNGGAAPNDNALVTTGLSVCATLDFGSAGDALVTAAAGLFGIEASFDELSAGAATTEQGITMGAVVASAVAFLCPEHRTRVEGFVADIKDLAPADGG